MKKKHILLVEDDFDFGTMLKQYLELNNFKVTWGKDGLEGLSLSNKGAYNLFIIDVMMPKMDGFTLAEKLVESTPEVPLLFLTARKTKEDKIKGLKLGADDYVVKPFEAEELVYRIKNIISRTERQNVFSEIPEKDIIAIGNYNFDFGNLKLSINENSKKLTSREAKLLYYLFQNKNSVITREEVLAHVWGKTDFFSGRSMDVFVSRLRKYLKEDKNIEIASIRGVGLEFNLN
ncbi:response regulator transcription factor [Patiriisocius hiemis]|uniref:Response regulator transcription factor n=1 Tax=Patiriisocius hiemis TaxID=3075604 RepID=A0ABU2YE70_9FLAO|nr:response regulator transcription factor [Constantimarinum sp. W242]MDT0555343.1 response regulator transcription factor [Constantimarinum sp. W242]